MLLSNPCKSFLPALICIIFFQACGSSSGNENKPVVVPAETKSRFPFPTKEPEVYQGDFVIGNGISEQQYFVARKGDKWRFDVKRNSEPWTTQLRSDRIYFIDHEKKTYRVEQPAEEKDYGSGHFNSLTSGFFRGANYLEFEEVERGAGVIKYKARTYKDSKSDVMITIDEASGIMVRQEITSDKDRTDQGTPVNYVYEVRNLRVDVDDSIFEIPAGYRRSSQ